MIFSGLGITIFVASRQAVATLESYKATISNENMVREKFNEIDKDKSGALDAAE